MFEPKYHMSVTDNILFAKRNIVDMIWRSARLEGFGITFPETYTIYEQGKLRQADMDAVLCVINLKRAWQRVFTEIGHPVTLDTIIALNAEVARDIALKVGQLRDGDVSGTTYRPLIPEPASAEADLRKLLAIESPVERALETFAWCCKAQLFYDGNTRTAMLAANQILIGAGMGCLSVGTNQILDFSERLHDYYEYDDKASLVQWLYDNAVDGVTTVPASGSSSGSVTVTSQPSRWPRVSR
jgi:hypothetical protein